MRIKTGIILTAVLFIFFSCKKSTTILKDGTWKVSLYSENGNDATNHFTGYVFTFESNGTVSAVHGSTTISGTYSKSKDDNTEKLTLNFGAGVLDEINDDWKILEEKSSKIRLQDDSGGGSGTELLNFEKI